MRDNFGCMQAAKNRRDKRARRELTFRRLRSHENFLSRESVFDFAANRFLSAWLLNRLLTFVDANARISQLEFKNREKSWKNFK